MLWKSGQKRNICLVWIGPLHVTYFRVVIGASLLPGHPYFNYLDYGANCSVLVISILIAYLISTQMLLLIHAESPPIWSTKCQLRQDLINKFMRCKEFARMCRHRQGVLNPSTYHRSLAVFLWGQSRWYFSVTSVYRNCVCFDLHGKTAYWFLCGK